MTRCGCSCLDPATCLLLQKEGYAILRDHVPAPPRTALVETIKQHVSRWVPQTNGDLQKLLQVESSVWMSTPEGWSGPSWGAKCRLGWQPRMFQFMMAFGGGKFF